MLLAGGEGEMMGWWHRKGVTSSDFCFIKAALVVAQIDGEIRPGGRGTSSKDSAGILGTTGGGSDAAVAMYTGRMVRWRGCLGVGSLRLEDFLVLREE